MKITPEKQEERLLSISMWRESGLSQGAFCKREGISRSTFQHWRKRLDSTYEHMPKRKQKNSNKFYSIDMDTVSELPSVSVMIEILYPNGVLLKCSNHIAEKQLSHLVNLSIH